MTSDAKRRIYREVSERFAGGCVCYLERIDSQLLARVCHLVCVCNGYGPLAVLI
jgi:hypothetical protein